MTCNSVADVLLVDFSDAVRSTTTEILRVSGYSVAEADDYDTALELLEEKCFRLLLLDPDLPRRSGIELLHSVERLPPVVIISAQPIEPEDLRRIDQKVTACFRKPIEPSKLVFIVSSITSRSDIGLTTVNKSGT